MTKILSKPLISVIVPVYNAAPYLEKCINSIRNQTYENLEIILVNDGSSDESPSLCNAFQVQDARIKVLHKENGGAASARKEGIKLATGDYTTYVDSDDWIEPDMYERMVGNLQDADVVICGIERDSGPNINFEVNAIAPGVYQEEKLSEIYAKMIYTGHFYEWGILPFVYNKLFRTELLRRNQLKVPDKIRVGEDPACCYPALLEAKKIVILRECLYHYQMRDDSVMGINDGKEIEHYKVFYSYLKSRFSEVEEWKENLILQMEYMMLFMLMLKNLEVFQNQGESLFPYADLEKGARIALYGAGRFGHELVRYIRGADDYTLMAWVDSNARGEIQKISTLQEKEFDYVLIAVLKSEIQKEIIDNIAGMGIPGNRIKGIDMELIEKGRALVEDTLSSK